MQRRGVQPHTERDAEPSKRRKTNVGEAGGVGAGVGEKRGQAKGLPRILWTTIAVVVLVQGAVASANNAELRERPTHANGAPPLLDEKSGGGHKNSMLYLNDEIGRSTREEHCGATVK